MSTPFGTSVFDREAIIGGKELSRGSFNALMGVVLFWGFAVNAITCCLFGDQIMRILVQGSNMVIFLIAYLVLALVGIFINHKSTNPAISFLGYNMVVVPMGVSIMLALNYASMAAIQSAFIVTAIVCVAMVAASNIFPNVFAKMSHSLFVSLIVGIIAQVICYFVAPGITGIFDWIFALIFSGYIGYDWYRAQRVQTTADNAVDCACALYIDIINLFIRLVRIFGKK